jgi:hypothetical protein
VYLTLPEGTFTGTNNYTTDANFTFDSIQNLTIMFDFTASNVIINKYENEVVNTLLTIENPRSSVSDCIFKLDSEGNLGQYDNRNWGYNIVSSNLITAFFHQNFPLLNIQLASGVTYHLFRCSVNF